MAKGNANGGTGLNLTARLSVEEAIKNAQRLKKELAELGVGLNSKNTGASAASTNAITQAQSRMTKAMRDSIAETQRLIQEGLRLRNEYQQGRITAQQLAAQTRALNEQRRAEAAALRLARQAQRAATGSYQEAQERLKQLGREIRSVAGGLQASGPIQQARIREYAQLNAQLAAFDRRLGNHQRNVGNYRSALSGLGSSLMGMAASYVSATAILAGISKVVSNNAEISDSLSDVRRTAALTEVEANNLLETFKKFDTRTILKGLLEIAGIGGQIGIAKEDLEGFTRSIDKLSIVLANEIPGGADAVATALGKINGVFDVQRKENTTVEESFNKTGAAILGLGQAGLATGDFLVDFTQRVSGTAKQAGISLPTVLAYGSVLEEAGKSAEVAGSSLNKLIAGLSVNRAQYFAIAKLGDAKLTLEQFTKVINTDVNGALQMFFKGLNSGNPTQTAFADRLKTIPRLAGETRNSIIALAQGQVKLSEKIKISNEDYLDADKISEQAALKMDNLAGSIDKLGKAFENATTSGNTANFFKNIIDWLGKSLNEFDKLVNSKSWGEFFERLSGKGLAGTLGGIYTGNTIATVAGVKELLSGKLSKEFDINKAIRDLTKKTNDNQKFLYPSNGSPDKQEAKLKDLGADSFNKYLASLKKTTEEAKKTLDSFKADVKSGAAVEIGFGIKGFTETYNKAETYYKDVLALQKKFGFDKKKEDEKQTNNSGLNNPSGKEKREAENAIQRAKTLGAELSKNRAASLRNQKESDNAELDSVKDKYDAMRTKIDEFYANGKNKGQPIVIDGKNFSKKQAQGYVNADQKRDEDLIKANQAIEATKIQVDAQKQIFADYEQYKTQFGESEAEKRFAADLKGYRTFVKYVESLIPAESDQTVADNKLRDLINKTLLPKANKDQVAIQKKLYDDAFQTALTHAQKLTLIDEEYNRRKLALGKNATKDQLNNLVNERDAKRRSVNEEKAYAISGYAELMENMLGMTKQAVLERLAIIKAGYEQDKTLTPAQKANLTGMVDNKVAEVKGSDNPFSKAITSIREYRKAVGEGKKDTLEGEAASKKMFGAIGEAAQASAQIFGDVTGALQNLGIGMDEYTQATIKNVTDILGGVAELAKGIKSVDPVSIVSGSIKILSSAIDLFNVKDKRLNRQIKAYQADLDSLGKAYKQLERDVQNAVGNDVYSKQSEEIANLQAQQQKLIAMRDAESQKKKKDQGKINDLNNQIDEIPNKIADINASISQNLIQGTFRELSNSLADALTSAFKSGEDGIEAMNKSFDDFIANAIKNSLKLAILDEPIKQFTDELTKYAQGHGNSVVGFDFEAWKKKLDAAGDNFNKGLEESKDFFKGDESQTSKGKLAGQLQADLTEKTGSLFLGVARSSYEQQKIMVELQSQTSLTLGQMYAIATKHLQSALNTEANTLRGANNTDGIGDKLDKIVANTTPKVAATQTKADLGL